MRRPKILLVNPWIHDFAAYDLWARPMGLLVLATKLRKLGWEPRLLDCLDRDHPSTENVKFRPGGHGPLPKAIIPKPPALMKVPRRYCRYGVSPEHIREDLVSMSTPKVILVTGLMTYWYAGVRETVSLLREVFPQVPVLLGGVYASLMPDHARQAFGVNEVVAGPGEAKLPDVLHRHTGLRPTAKEISGELEFRPALDLVQQVRFLPLLTSRGCPFRCAYCASGRLIPRFVRRDPDEIVREVEEARLRYGTLDIALYDDAFLVDAKTHALPLLNAMAWKVPGMRWHTPNGLHASAIDGEVALAMKRAGFETIRLGLESSSNKFHSRTGGKTDRESFRSAVRHLKEAGFDSKRIGVYLLVGLPGQTRQQIEADVDLVLQEGAFPKLAEYSPIPGTALWQEALLSARYPIDQEPLFHNCTLLPAADPDVDRAFLQTTRKGINDYFKVTHHTM